MSGGINPFSSGTVPKNHTVPTNRIPGNAMGKILEDVEVPGFFP